MWWINAALMLVIAVMAVVYYRRSRARLPWTCHWCGESLLTEDEFVEPGRAMHKECEKDWMSGGGLGG